MSHLNQVLNKFGLANGEQFNCLYGTPVCNKATGECFCDTSGVINPAPLNVLTTKRKVTDTVFIDYQDYCKRLPAPSGFHHEYFQGQGCVLVSNATGQPSQVQSVLPIAQGEINPSMPLSVNSAIESAKSFFSEHKFLTLAGVGVLGYMLFSGGLGASERTVTSVTRYAPKRKNPSKRRKTYKRR